MNQQERLRLEHGCEGYYEKWDKLYSFRKNEKSGLGYYMKNIKRK